jgi:hypothetical protein
MGWSTLSTEVSFDKMGFFRYCGDVGVLMTKYHAAFFPIASVKENRHDKWFVFSEGRRMARKLYD